MNNFQEKVEEILFSIHPKNRLPETHELLGYLKGDLFAQSLLEHLTWEETSIFENEDFPLNSILDFAKRCYLKRVKVSPRPKRIDVLNKWKQIVYVEKDPITAQMAGEFSREFALPIFDAVELHSIKTIEDTITPLAIRTAYLFYKNPDLDAYGDIIQRKPEFYDSNYHSHWLSFLNLCCAHVLLYDKELIENYKTELKDCLYDLSKNFRFQEELINIPLNEVDRILKLRSSLVIGQPERSYKIWFKENSSQAWCYPRFKGDPLLDEKTKIEMYKAYWFSRINSETKAYGLAKKLYTPQYYEDFKQELSKLYLDNFSPELNHTSNKNLNAFKLAKIDQAQEIIGLVDLALSETELVLRLMTSPKSLDRFIFKVWIAHKSGLFTSKERCVDLIHQVARKKINSNAFETAKTAKKSIRERFAFFEKNISPSFITEYEELTAS